MEVKDTIRSQYLAALEMLEQAVERCPDTMRDDRSYKNVFWLLVYHVFFYLHLYLYAGLSEYQPWPKHKTDRQRMKLDGGEPYSQADLLEYLESLRGVVAAQVAALDLESPSGFEWLPFSRLETHLYSLRHMQQHIGELCERLGEESGVSVDWVGRGRKD